MYGGEITDNSARLGNGVLVGEGSFTVGGTAKITGNRGENVYLFGDKKFNISKEIPLREGAKIGIYKSPYSAPRSM